MKNQDASNLDVLARMQDLCEAGSSLEFTRDLEGVGSVTFRVSKQLPKPSSDVIVNKLITKLEYTPPEDCITRADLGQAIKNSLTNLG